MHPTIKEWPAFSVIGLLYHGNNQQGEIPALWPQLMARTQEIPRRPGAAFGVCDNFDQGASVFDYVAGYEAAPGGDAPPGMVKWEIPAHTYACFATTLPEIRATMGRIYAEWFPASAYVRAEGPEFEYYGPDFDGDDPASRLSICVPVVKR